MKSMPWALLGACVVCWVAPVSAQTLISQFSFEIFTPPDSSGTGSAGPFNADFGPGSMSAVHASSTNFSTPPGNGSANSFSASNWGLGDYFQFTLNTTGFNNLFVTFSMSRSSTGSASFQLSYSSDGGTNFSLLGSPFAISTTSFSAGSYNAGLVSTFDLSGLAALNNNANVVIRLVATAGGTSSAGTVRLDDFLLSSGGPLTVPEPATWACLAGSIALSGAEWLRRRRRIPRACSPGKVQ